MLDFDECGVPTWVYLVELVTGAPPPLPLLLSPYHAVHLKQIKQLLEPSRDLDVSSFKFFLLGRNWYGTALVSGLTNGILGTFLYTYVW